MCESEQCGREAPPQWHGKIVVSEAVARILKERAERGDANAQRWLAIVVANPILRV